LYIPIISDVKGMATIKIRAMYESLTATSFNVSGPKEAGCSYGIIIG
jgi:hypothetical protein